MSQETKNPFAPSFDDLPASIPIFPLNGVLLLPTGRLPLNIFEPCYIKMVEDALAGNRLIGMIQPLDGQERQKNPSVYNCGCVGKITAFEETTDGRFEITLTGLSRFHVQKELDVTTPYRQANVDWSEFKDDLSNISCLDIDRKYLLGLLECYFKAQGMSCDWEAVNDASDGRLITCLSMVCPFDAKEKQALLEAKCCKSRAKIFMTMLEIATKDMEEIEKGGCGCGKGPCH